MYSPPSAVHFSCLPYPVYFMNNEHVLSWWCTGLFQSLIEAEGVEPVQILLPPILRGVR